MSTHNNTPDREKVAGEAIREKVTKLIRARADIVGRLRDNSQDLRDAVAAARLFGVAVSVPKDFLTDVVEAATESQAKQPNLFAAADTAESSIREVVLQELKAIGSRGTKAGPLRLRVEKRTGRELHYKTIGMTLYRLSLKGLAHRDGLMWYPTTKVAETKTPAS
jgi:pyridoxine 5'-phosphate synthase PdxJ